MTELVLLFPRLARLVLEDGTGDAQEAAEHWAHPQLLLALVIIMRWSMLRRRTREVADACDWGCTGAPDWALAAAETMLPLVLEVDKLAKEELAEEVTPEVGVSGVGVGGWVR